MICKDTQEIINLKITPEALFEGEKRNNWQVKGISKNPKDLVSGAAHTKSTEYLFFPGYIMAKPKGSSESYEILWEKADTLIETIT